MVWLLRLFGTFVYLCTYCVLGLNFNSVWVVVGLHYSWLFSGRFAFWCFGAYCGLRWCGGICRCCVVVSFVALSIWIGGLWLCLVVALMVGFCGFPVYDF